MKQKKVTVISLAEVKAILSKLDLEEADQIQKRTLDYVKGFPDSNPKKIDSAAEKIAELGSISLEDAYEILNICPKTIPELRVFTSGWKKLIPSETLDEILSVIQQACD